LVVLQIGKAKYLSAPLHIMLYEQLAQSSYVMYITWACGEWMTVEVPTEVAIKIMIFWDMTPCSPVDRYQ
jgi:hypothetical protein